MNEQTKLPREADLRDWFAGLAMQGFVSNPKGGYFHTEEEIAVRAYTIADEMLRRREISNESA